MAVPWNVMVMHRTFLFSAHLIRNARLNSEGLSAMPNDDEIRQILRGPGTSHGLKNSLTSALDARDVIKRAQNNGG